MPLKSLFGQNLQTLRKLNNFSQEQLAKKLGISKKHLSTLETGKTFASAELIEKISKTLNVSYSALFKSSEDTPITDTYLIKLYSLLDNEISDFSTSLKLKINCLNN